MFLLSVPAYEKNTEAAKYGVDPQGSNRAIEEKQFPCGSGEIGRHTILRGWRLTACGFKSRLPHQKRSWAGLAICEFRSQSDLLKQRTSMQILFYFVIVVHVIVCLFMIGVVLIQQGRSADLAGAFGGQGSQTAFGPRAAANVLTRLTTWAAVIFMCTSLALVVLFVRASGSHSVLEGVKSAPAPASAPAKPGK